MKKLRVFYSYSHADSEFQNQLWRHLVVCRRLELIEEWYDRMLRPGTPLDEKIAEELTNSDVILLLISVDFLNSWYCYDKEMTLALERHRANQAVVVPIILRPTDGWTELPIGNLIALPEDGKPISKFGDRDEACAQVASALRGLFKDLAKPLTTDHQCVLGATMPNDNSRNYLLSTVQEWSDRADLREWSGWTSGIYHGSHGVLDSEAYDRLSDLNRWLLNRVWPNDHNSVVDSLQKFRLILNDFLKVLSRHAEETNGEYRTKKFYHIDEWNTELYEKLYADYDKHIMLLEGLMDELTRSANHVCDQVRSQLDPSFRLAEGVLVVQKGPFEDLSTRTYRLEYDGETFGYPYPGLDAYTELLLSLESEN